MYSYDQYDHRLVRERVAQFRGQVSRRLSGEITEEEFKPLRLQNGLYLQLHAYMLRIAIPYGILSSPQMRQLAHIARRWDRGYGHFTTRQNIQFNWTQLVDVPDILAALADVEMHAIQTSGNCVRNITTDHLAGVARDEIEDPRPWCELTRQWSTFHPEFAHLPRKFKIAFTATPGHDRAAIKLHDIGVRLTHGEGGEPGFQIWVGGGMGRTPIVGLCIREFLPRRHLLSYIESILRVYNLLGRRDNIFKARIKILVGALGIERFRAMVEEDWAENRDGALVVDDAEIERMQSFFAPAAYAELTSSDALLESFRHSADEAFARWARNDVVLHRQPGYSAVVLSLKSFDSPAGDLSDSQMDAVAALAERFGFGEIRTTHTQDLVLPDVRTSDLPELWRELVALDLATANVGRLTDLICCPGLDFCNLANARSIPVGQEIRQRFDDLDYLDDIGPVSVKISGCINACGHHHVGNIGILGIDKKGIEHYQLMLGGSADDDASLGRVLGPAFPREAIVAAVEKVLRVYLTLREGADEAFIETYRRLGDAPFRDALYGDVLYAHQAEA